MSINTLKQQAELLLDKLNSGKRFLLGNVHKRLEAARADHPGDIVVQSMASVIERMYDKEPDCIISQAQLENVYQELVGLNSSGTKFREVFGDLLMPTDSAPSNENEDFVGGLRDDPDRGEVNYDSDSQVQEGFEGLFGMKSDNYNPQLASDAKDKVGSELNSMGFDRHRVRLAGGNSQFLVFAADLDTNRGAVRVLIPSEASGETFPSVFVAGNKFENLTHANLKTYIEEAALRNQRMPEVRDVLSTLSAVTGNVQKYASDNEFQKLTSTLPEEGDGFSDHGVFTSMPDRNEAARDIEIDQTPLPEPLKGLASNFEESVLEASVGCPQVTVRLAKRMLLAEFAGMGFKGTQLRIVEPTNDGFICEATLNTPAGKVMIEVPVEMNGDIPLMPSIFAKEDYVAEFNQANLHAVVKSSSDLELSTIRTDSPLGAMSLYELKDVITRAAAREDYNSCDEALEVIAARFDVGTYSSAVVDYQKVLSNLNEANSQISQAYDDSDQFVRTPNSLYPVHKKLRRPAQELIRDANGEYHLKSTYHARQNQEEESAFFSNAKALLGD